MLPVKTSLTSKSYTNYVTSCAFHADLNAIAFRIFLRKCKNTNDSGFVTKPCRLWDPLHSNFSLFCIRLILSKVFPWPQARKEPRVKLLWLSLAISKHKQSYNAVDVHFQYHKPCCEFVTWCIKENKQMQRGRISPVVTRFKILDSFDSETYSETYPTTFIFVVMNKTNSDLWSFWVCQYGDAREHSKTSWIYSELHLSCTSCL